MAFNKIPETESDLWRKQIGDLLKSGKYILKRDGWSMPPPEYFIAAGFPADFIEPLVETIKSDGTWKGSLWKDQVRALNVISKMQALPQDTKLDDIPYDLVREFSQVYIAEQEGIYYLTFLRGLEQLFGLKARGCLGRGSQASEIIKVIHEHLGMEQRY
jgi:hypothetical protein